MRLLFVDDERGFPLPGVEYAGEFDVARTSKEAIGFLENEEYTYVFLDYDLGKMDTAHSVVLYLRENEHPSIELIWVHSQNPPAAKQMVDNLEGLYDVRRYLWKA